MRSAILKTDCDYKGYFKRQTASLKQWHWLMLKKKSAFLAQPQKRHQWCDLTIIGGDKFCIIMQSTLRSKSKLYCCCQNRVVRRFCPTATSDLTYCSQILYKFFLHMLLKNSSRCYSTWKKNSHYENQHLQTHFPRIKVGQIKHRTKVVLCHMQFSALGQFRNGTSCSPFNPTHPLMWQDQSRYKEATNISSCAKHRWQEICLSCLHLAFNLWLSCLTVTETLYRKIVEAFD